MKNTLRHNLPSHIKTLFAINSGHNFTADIDASSLAYEEYATFLAPSHVKILFAI